MTHTTATPALTLIEQNPWYLLATLYGVPGRNDKELKAKNRTAWNRYYASQWTNEERERLKGRVDKTDLAPLDVEELVDIRRQFAERAGGSHIDLPGVDSSIDFTEYYFDKEIHFGEYIFGDTGFSSASFSGDADFRSVIFNRGASFDGATFSGYADFGISTFNGYTDFSSTSFSRDAFFVSATFSRYTDFSSASFFQDAAFSDVTFSGYAIFDGVAFTNDAAFNSTTFTRDANFGGTTFHQAALFTNSELKAPTHFGDSKFMGAPPRFHGAKLHEDMVWRGVYWPPAPSNPNEAARFTDAYERLKLEMDRLKKHEDELMFFAKELECRRVARGQIRGWPIGAYGVLCHYGQSYLRPLGWLVALILVGAVQFWPALNWDFLSALGVSTANTLGPLGLRKELMEAGTLPTDLSRWLRFVSGAQMVIGLILLFLIGLGLRNRFRMK